jgi:hypothetical protein
MRGLRFQSWFKISYPCFIYGNNSVQSLFTFCFGAPQEYFCDPLLSCFLFFAQLMQNTLCSDSSAMIESRSWKQKRLTSLLHVQFLHMICVDLLPTECRRYPQMCGPLLLLAARFLGRLGCLTDLHGNEMLTVTPWYNPLHYPRKHHVKHYDFGWVYFSRKFNFNV